MLCVTYQLIDRHKIPLGVAGLTPEMNQRPQQHIMTLASFTDIHSSAIAKFFVGS